MNDFREDSLTGRRVLIAEHRANRPNELRQSVPSEATDDSPRADCVFCPGNESQTPDERYSLRSADGTWRVRVVPNNYPAVGVGLDRGGAPGVHEVIIESARHCQRTGQLSAEELTDVLAVYAHRLQHLAADPSLSYRLVFKNVGRSAGASLEHLHAQVIGMKALPPAVAAERQRLDAYYEETGRCGWCDRLAEVTAEQERVITLTDDWVIFCPFAARQPYETWILPRQCEPNFESLAAAPEMFDSLADVLLPVIRSIEQAIGDDGYNLMLHTGPTTAGHGHWRMEILPRVASLAGLELASGLFMNVLSPERAAAELRERIAAADT